MKRILLILVVILLGAVFLAGYWPQHKLLLAAQDSNAQIQQQLTNVQAVARVCRLENNLLALLGQTESQNYGEARNLSNAFFDSVRQEADRPQNAAFKSDLENILSQRDPVTAGLARTDATTVTTLRQILSQLQQLMQKLAGQANL
ncbi:MAG TPA: hypothetical protein VLV49_05700 [Terriglobales bacterium]|nr:hypothetical protein [Terriglobales bacterium]